MANIMININNNQITPLNCAKKGEWRRAIELLENAQENKINFQHIKDKTYAIIHQAAWWGVERAVLEALHLLGANFKLNSSEGTPFAIAKREGHDNTADVITEMLNGSYVVERSLEQLKNEIVVKEHKIYEICKSVDNLDAATPDKLERYKEQPFQKFCYAFPGEGYSGGGNGTNKWLHTSCMSEEDIKNNFQQFNLHNFDYKAPIFAEIFSALGRQNLLSIDVAKAVIKLYTSSKYAMYDLINTVLRMNEWMYVNKLGSIIFPLKLTCEGYFKEFQCYGGTVYRGLAIPIDGAVQLAEMKEGNVFYFPAFTSCTKDKSIAAFFSDAGRPQTPLLGLRDNHNRQMEGNSLIVMEIRIKKEHRCAVDLKSINPIEKEVLISMYTRFKLIEKRENEKVVQTMDRNIDYYLVLETMEPAYKNISELTEEMELRERISDYSKLGDFNEVLKLCKGREYLLNSFRPTSSKLWTPLHQAAYFNNHSAYKKLLAAGAVPMYNAEGQLPVLGPNSCNCM